eukprot:gene6111-6729_t
MSSTNQPVLTSTKPLHFYALGDFGTPTYELKTVAKAMSNYAIDNPPKFVLGLGDNFYPRGVTSSHDPQFQDSWRDVFLLHPSLRVPWKMVLGNHDYDGNAHAQIDYHYDETFNGDRLWYCPDYNYQFSLQQPAAVDFFALDTNGCQFLVKGQQPSLVPKLHDYISSLKEQLKESQAEWKFVFGHHPLYTQGRGHAVISHCLREKVFWLPPAIAQQPPGHLSTPSLAVGFGLEEVLLGGGVDVYFSGHEHVFQYHQSFGLHHACCGASGAQIRKDSGLLKGVDPSVSLDWVGKAQDIGFAAIEINGDSCCIRFLDTSLEVLKEVIVNKRSPAEKKKDLERYLEAVQERSTVQ